MTPSSDNRRGILAASAVLCALLAVPTAAAAPGSAPEPIEDGSAEAAAAGPEGIDIDVSGHLGVGVRLDDPPAYPLVRRAGLLFGVGVGAFLTDGVQLGLGYEHVDLGVERSPVSPWGALELDRDLNSLWLELRLYPLQWESFGAFVEIGTAMAWQSLGAAGLWWPSGDPGRGIPFSCEGCDSVALGLRAAAGVDLKLAGGLRLLTAAGLDSYGLSDEPLDGCAPGAGSAGSFALRAGLGYRFRAEP